MLLLTRLWLSFTFFFANYAPATSIAFGLHIDIEKRPASAVHHFAPDGDLPEQIKKLADEDLVRLGTLYLRDIRNIAPSAARVTDKMPSNFRFAGLIQLALPNARIIHTRRDPVDTCVSCFSTLFARGQTIAYELGELVGYYQTYERLMDHWRGVLPEGMMLEVSYENLVTDFEAQARRILAHCGLEWDEACLDFYKTKRAVKTASAGQVHRPLYSSSVGRRSWYGDLLRPLLDALS